MKNLMYVTVAVFLLFITSKDTYAQDSPIDQGKAEFSLGLGLPLLTIASPATTSPLNHSFRISPSYAYFLRTGFSLDLNLDYSFDATEQTNSAQTSIGPGITYYLPFGIDNKAERRFFSYVKGGANYLWYQQNDDQLDAQYKFLTAHASVGAKYFVFKQAGIFYNLGYEYRHQLNDRQSAVLANNKVITSFGITFTW